MKKIKFVNLLLIHLISSISLAEIPSHTYLASETENSRIKINCSYDSKTEIMCKLSQLSVIKNPPQDTESKVKEILAIEKSPEGKKKFEQFKLSNCSEGKLNNKITNDKEQWIKNKLSNLNNDRLILEKKELADLHELCSCKDLSCFTGKLVEQTKYLTENTCKIFDLQSEMKFKKVSDRSWVSNEGPVGICGAIVVTKLESDEKYPILWTYTQNRIITNKTKEPCSKLEDSKMVFSWGQPSEILLDCKIIQMTDF